MRAVSHLRNRWFLFLFGLIFAILISTLILQELVGVLNDQLSGLVEVVIEYKLGHSLAMVAAGFACAASSLKIVALTILG